MPAGFRLILAVFCAFLYLGCTLWSAYLGYEWLYEGSGLNPWVAFPLSFACLIGCHVCLLGAEREWTRWVDSLRDESHA